MKRNLRIAYWKVAEDIYEADAVDYKISLHSIITDAIIHNILKKRNKGNSVEMSTLWSKMRIDCGHQTLFFSCRKMVRGKNSI